MYINNKNLCEYNKIYVISQNKKVMDLLSIILTKLHLKSVKYITNPLLLKKEIDYSLAKTSLFIYDSDFSKKISTKSLIKFLKEIDNSTTIFILGNGPLEALQLINAKTLPDGYISKNDSEEKVFNTLLYLLWQV